VHAQVSAACQGLQLGGGFLVATLPDVGDAESGEQVDVRRREELRDDDQGELVGAARVAPGPLDAVVDGAQVQLKVSTSPC
jgi:hypothetical protein